MSEELGMFSTFDISSSGLSAQRVRMNTIANNIANVNTTRTPEGGPFKREEVIFEYVMADAAESEKESGKGVKVAKLRQDPTPPIMLYRPEHPDADENGYVAMPNVNPVKEMTDMISASRSYEANVTSITSAKQIIDSAMNIIKN